MTTLSERNRPTRSKTGGRAGTFSLDDGAGRARCNALGLRGPAPETCGATRCKAPRQRWHSPHSRRSHLGGALQVPRPARDIHEALARTPPVASRPCAPAAGGRAAAGRSNWFASTRCPYRSLSVCATLRQRRSTRRCETDDDACWASELFPPWRDMATARLGVRFSGRRVALQAAGPLRAPPT
jgi:hypothetical protein